MPVDPRLTLLADIDYFWLDSYKILLAHFLSAASLVIAKPWKLQEVPALEDWVSKFQDIWLSSKLSTVGAGNMGAPRKSNSQWAVLIESGYVIRAQNIKETLLTVI